MLFVCAHAPHVDCIIEVAKVSVVVCGLTDRPPSGLANLSMCNSAYRWPLGKLLWLLAAGGRKLLSHITG